MMKRFTNEWKVLLYVDYHGHSWKKNAFVYGCNFKGQDFDNRRKNALISVYPLLLGRLN